MHELNETVKIYSLASTETLDILILTLNVYKHESLVLEAKKCISQNVELKLKWELVG